MLATLRKWVREPLVQFMTIAVLLFVSADSFFPRDEIDSPYAIEVDKTALLKFLQYRNKAFNASAAADHWQRLSASDREALITDYVRDEVLYREAINLGLDEDDQIIRRRLIQKLDYITAGFIDDTAKISEQELASYFSVNQNDYTIDASLTFTHVFIDASKHDVGSRSVLAGNTLQQLNEHSVPFEKAPNYGDRFIFHRNYVDRTPAFVVSHFGEEFSDEVFKLSEGSHWYGPYESRYGTHLVQVRKNIPGYLPRLDEVAALVLEDVRRVKLDEKRRQAVDNMIGKYSLHRNLPKAKVKVKDSSVDIVRYSHGLFPQELANAQ
ncbi:MAG TPA: peptidyl-prolyl cis-trans isomerase [Porticoccus sp.]|nr:peptidyl-prolyl cis-trans isomerase [Porticoccus sp.]